MSALLELAARVEAASGPDRELDGEIAEQAFGWKPAPCPPDYDGKNAGEVLTPDGKPFTVNGKLWVYPPKGAVHRAYHCEQYTRDCCDPAFPRDAIRQRTAAVLRARAQTPSHTEKDHG